MKNKYNTINNSNIKEKQRINPNIISHLFFQLKDDESNKIKKTRNNNKIIKQNSSNKIQIRKNFINTIMTETNYVYNESNIKNKDSNIKSDIFYMKMNSSDKINKAYFPIQQFNKSIFIPKIIKIKKKHYNSAERNKIKNLTYKNKFINKPNYFSFQNLSLNNLNNKKENSLKNLYNYEITLKLLNNNKKIFKV